MIRHKMARPAIAQTMNGPRKSDQLGSEISSTNTPQPDQLQAPDISGENDELFFRRRPGVRQRLRLPFTAELPPEVWQAAVAAGLAAFVIVEMKRGAPGVPWIRSRQFVFAAGGTA
jgi:hypothetical protein